jgi:hypothetical protein
MKLKYILIYIMLSCSIGAFSQPSYYYYQGNKVGLTVDRDYVYIMAEDGFTKSASTGLLFQKLNLELDETKPVEGLAKLRINSTLGMQEYSDLIDSLKQDDRITHVFPFFERGDAEPIGTSDIFYVKLKAEGDTALLRQVAAEHSVQVIKALYAGMVHPVPAELFFRQFDSRHQPFL